MTPSLFIRTLFTRIAAACVLVGLTAGDASAQRYPQAILMPPANVHEDLALAREALETIHPGYTRYADRAELDAAWDRLADHAADMTDVELYVELSSLTAAIRCDHTKLELPERLRDARRGSATYFPFRIDVFDGDAVVLSTLAGSRLKPGDKVLSINGTPMAEILETIYALLPVDGYTDHVKPDAFTEAGDFGPSGFEHFYPLVYGEWASADIVVERAGERVGVSTSPVPFIEWRIMSWD